MAKSTRQYIFEGMEVLPEALVPFVRHHQIGVGLPAIPPARPRQGQGRMEPRHPRLERETVLRLAVRLKTPPVSLSSPPTTKVRHLLLSSFPYPFPQTSVRQTARTWLGPSSVTASPDLWRRWMRGFWRKRRGATRAVDTNIVVRYLTGDDPGQAAKAKAVIDAAMSSSAGQYYSKANGCYGVSTALPERKLRQRAAPLRGCHAFRSRVLTWSPKRSIALRSVWTSRMHCISAQRRGARPC